MKKFVLVLGFLAVAAPAFAQMQGGAITPIITPAIVNTTQPPTPANPARPEPPKN